MVSAACRLVLAGAGHAHLEVLRRLARRRIPGLDLTVISPGPAHHYSGMVPGYLGGAYRLDEIAIELAPLVAGAGGRLLLGRAVGLDPRRRVVEVEELADREEQDRTAGTGEDDRDGRGGKEPGGDFGAGGGPRLEVPYDLVAFAVGSDAAGAAAAEATAGGAVLSCKPIGKVVELRRRLHALAGERRRPETVAVVGGGAAGVEIALAFAARFAAAAATHRVVLVEAGPEILAGRPPGFRHRAERLLAGRGVEIHCESRVQEVEREGEGARLHLRGGGEFSCALAVWATAAVAWPLFRGSGLPLDDRGFLLIDESLRSVADAHVFAAGDCGTLAAWPSTAKAGVYAVREGPVLDRCLRAALAGGRPPRYRPQPGFMIILNTNDGRALLSYKGFASYGRWAFRLKDRIDRNFLARYQ
jgi:NADH dehydrogenase FAD-containing subunit